ncbi:unnamed protein product [Penicillium olsonii]|nr:unnamed protein product [Penicillium olsonii]CAG7928070.1 unnamed protein product [Penicillium olsonii]
MADVALNLAPCATQANEYHMMLKMDLSTSVGMVLSSDKLFNEASPTICSTNTGFLEPNDNPTSAESVKSDQHLINTKAFESISRPISAESPETDPRPIETELAKSDPHPINEEPSKLENHTTNAESVEGHSHPITSKTIESTPQPSNAESLTLKQHGLQWEEGLFGFEPHWSVEPDIEDIKATIQEYYPSSTVEVEFLAQGAFNKVYNATVDGKELIMRLSLPIDPHFKVLSEVATMNFVRRVTKLPVPEVIKFDSSAENRIGFEWILMTKMPGKPFGDVWLSLSFEAKAKLVRQLAEAASDLFEHQFEGIGNLYEESDVTENPSLPFNLLRAQDPNKAQRLAMMENANLDGSFDFPSANDLRPTSLPIGRAVCMQLAWKSRLEQRVPRGPFLSSKNWVAARLAVVRQESQSILDNLPTGDLSEDEEDAKDDSERTLNIVKSLTGLLPKFFPKGDSFVNSEPSSIFHSDITRHNLLVNNDGELAGVIDWEFVSAVPLWKACNYPGFLEGPPVPSKPSTEHFRSGEIPETYEPYLWELWDHEATLLREVFTKEMRVRGGRWIRIFDQSQHLRDLDMAVKSCENPLNVRHIKAWIRDLMAGKADMLSLKERGDRDHLSIVNME